MEPNCENKLNRNFFRKNSIFNELIFTSKITTENRIYTFTEQKIEGMIETMEHRIIRSKKNTGVLIKSEDVKIEIENIDENIPNLITEISNSKPLQSGGTVLLPEFHHYNRSPRRLKCQPTEMPSFLFGIVPKVHSQGNKMFCDSRAAQWAAKRHEQCENLEGLNLVNQALRLAQPELGWSNVAVPDKQTLITDAGKLSVLDSLLTRLKSQGHRVLIYSQMTKMIDLLEEYMWHRKYRYMRLDGSSKISARRDMVADFQSRADIFVFLLSTRAGGLGINLTAADTVSLFLSFYLFIFYLTKILNKSPKRVNSFVLYTKNSVFLLVPIKKVNSIDYK